MPVGGECSSRSNLDKVLGFQDLVRKRGLVRLRLSMLHVCSLNPEVLSQGTLHNKTLSPNT